MMRCVIAAVVCTVLAAAEAVPAHAQDRSVRTVYVRGDLGGGGITRRDGNRCYVISLDHVVRGKSPERAHRPGTLYVIAGQTGRITPEYLAQRGEFSILRVPAGDRGICMRWPSVGRVTKTLERLPREGRRGTIVQRTSSSTDAPDVGARIRRWDDRSVLLELDSGEVFRPGMSGSIVMIGTLPVAMLAETCEPSDSTTVNRCGTSRGIAYRLDHLDQNVLPVLRIEDPPTNFEKYGSVFIPGMGQEATRRRTKGIVLTGATVGAMVGVAQIRETVTETRTYTDALGTPRTYPYRVRQYRHRDGWSLATVWLLGGAYSAAETLLHVRDKYRASDENDQPARSGSVSVRMAPRPMVVNGVPAVALTIEFTF